jgi:hypothetical protein
MRGPLDLPRVDGVPKRDIYEGAVSADVAHRREARVERRARVGDAHQRVARRRTRERRIDVGGTDVADKVRVQVDEAGEHAVRRPVDQAGAARGPAPGRHGDDAAILDADRAVRKVLALLDVQHAAGAHHDRLGGRRIENANAMQDRKIVSGARLIFIQSTPSRFGFDA